MQRRVVKDAENAGGCAEHGVGRGGDQPVDQRPEPVPIGDLLARGDEIDQRGHVRLVEGDGALIGRDGFLEAVHAGIGSAEAGIGRGGIGLQPLLRREMGERRLETAVAAEQQAEAVMAGRVAGVDADAGQVGAERPVDPALRRQEVAEIIVAIGKIRRHLQQLAIVLLALTSSPSARWTVARRSVASGLPGRSLTAWRRRSWAPRRRRAGSSARRAGSRHRSRACRRRSPGGTAPRRRQATAAMVFERLEHQGIGCHVSVVPFEAGSCVTVLAKLGGDVKCWLTAGGQVRDFSVTDGLFAALCPRD